MVSKMLLFMLKGYKKNISPLLRNSCRFTPTCSEYAMQAIEVHGAAKGSVLAFLRVARCNPLCMYGYDPIPQKGSWKNPERLLYR